MLYKINSITEVDQDESSESDTDSQARLVMSINSLGNYKLPTILGKINGAEMRVAFDSGATVSCLSYDAAKRQGIEIFESKTKIKVADDLVRKVIGETEELDVEIRSHVCRDKFLVINHADHHALLGIP